MWNVSLVPRKTDCRMLALLVLLLGIGACAPEEESQGPVEPTPEPGPSLRKTTWTTMFYEKNDPLIQGDTVFFMNVETQEDGKVTGWFWHIWGELYVGGYDVPTQQVVALEGTYSWERQLVLTGSLYGHTARLEGLIWEEAVAMDVVLTLDTDAYELVDIFVPTDYVTVYPD